MFKKEFGKDFEDLKTNVKNLLDFNTFQYKDSYLGRRFDSRLRAFHLDSYHAYWDILKNDAKEQERLLKDLTINVTEFFRDNPVYDIFKKEVVPSVLKQNPGKIKIWSAGSSDGKEAYSIAMIFTETLHGHNVKDRVEIIGTDIDKDCLNHATNGAYESRPGIVQTDIAKQISFIKNIEQYFEIGENTFQVKPYVKELVNFQYHDLISGLKKKNFDIIFCRNVVIYFTRELQDVLYKDFYNALKPGGYFIMGKTETLFGESKELFVPYNSRERIFIKE